MRHAGTAENVAGAKFRDRLHRSGEPPLLEAALPVPEEALMHDWWFA